MSFSSSGSSSINIPYSSQRYIKSYFATILPFLKSDIKDIFHVLDSLQLSTKNTNEVNQFKIVEYLKPGSSLFERLEEFYNTASMLGNPLSSVIIPRSLKTPILLLEQLVQSIGILFTIRNFDTEYDVSNIIAKLYKYKNVMLAYLRDSNNINASNSNKNSNYGNISHTIPFPFENIELSAKSKKRTRKHSRGRR